MCRNDCRHLSKTNIRILLFYVEISNGDDMGLKYVVSLVYIFIEMTFYVIDGMILGEEF